ncbi:leucine-rich repeat-containing protein 43-like [Synchiropus splendidus]|uniref:leucine-rich repeat-containing protein 43-like n=1 Tax=Synchiropus splendidus TaxID=270530 RepID=UPI00237E6073|nr:leucine-rich repeat-containing protein 43-like [Synchiropus splendidus]XP_053727292.1 leucine-rich repeat-containing protein 43-like [Synchiropus splendidus]XP_053727293.1 leucine-rich repeat-containing protein 43-like [Synchiropus splendidus]
MASGSITLTSVLEKLIHHLCLDDFPCGCGSWKKKPTAELTEAPEMPSEETELLDLLSCPHSPWKSDESWSPQAAALRRLAVVSPGRVNDTFIFNYFRKLRVVDRHVSVIDDGLLRFSKLEQLILSANRISKIPVANLPKTLRVLDLRANLLNDLSNLSESQPPHLHYLGLSSNTLGSSEDMTYFTKDLWPQVVCLDLSDCEFGVQQELLDYLSELPHLKSLMLQGNPLTLARSYPGFTIDRLPHLSFLDASQILPDDRQRFRGLVQRSDATVEPASVTVCVGTMRGLPDPMMDVGENAPEYPVITYSYCVTYKFFTDRASTELEPELEVDKTAAEENQRQVNALEAPRPLPFNVAKHSTPKLAWAESMEFGDSQTHAITDLRGFKRFLKHGLDIQIEQEKTESWPATPEEMAASKLGKKETAKQGNKDRPKNKRNTIELVPGPPITTVVCAIQVPMHGLLRGIQNIDTVCDFGILQPKPKEEKEEEKEEVPEKPEPEIKEEPKKAKKKGKEEKNSAKKPAGKGKQKGKKESVVEEAVETSVPEELKPVTVELSVELQRWRSASEATVAAMGSYLG